MASELSLDKQSVKLLSLCIPTYNRSECLRKQFNRLLLFSPELLEQIEIIVSDNCSSDDTPHVVEQFQNKLSFVYYRNEENVGPDKNFLQCLRKSTGKYVWLLGDDDLLVPDHFPELLQLLSEKNIGLLHVSQQKNSKSYRIYTDVDLFLCKINIFITFMSANIFRRELVTAFDYTPYEKTNLLQVPMYLRAALAGEVNVHFCRPLFQAATVAASNGGYNLIRVFVKNLLNILDEFEELGISPHTIMIIRNKSSDFIFPYVFNFMILKKRSDFDTKNGWAIIREYLGIPRMVLSGFKFLFTSSIIPHVVGKFFKFLVQKLMWLLTKISLLLIPSSSSASCFARFKNGIISRRLSLSSATPKSVCLIEGPVYIRGEKFIHFGQKFSSRPGLRIECLKRGETNPMLTIGDDVNFNFNVHIGVINKVSIGNRVLVGSNVLITDHSHGHSDNDSLQTPPNLRELFSKGPVVIEDDVWIGENVCILPGVTIGRGSIVGANAVVTKSAPPYSRLVGNPARTL